MGGKYTEEEMSGLSQEERDAINGDDASVDDATLSEIAGDDELDDPEVDNDIETDDEPGADPGAGENETVDDPAAGVDTPESPNGDADESADPFDIEVPAIAFVPKFTGELLPEFQAEIDKLDTQLDEGNLTLADHRRQVRVLEAQSNNAEASKQLWAEEQKVFLKHNPEFNATKNQILFGALNQEVIRLANSPEAEGKSGIQILYAARNNVEKALGVVKAQTVKPVVEVKPKAVVPKHQTLGKVPAAEAAEDLAGSRFAHLDKLTGLDLERALSKLSPADMEAYQRGN